MFSRLFHKDTADLPLTEEELQLRQQRRKRIAIIAASILVLLLAGYLSARPVLNAVRAWQARRHAEKAFALIDQQQWGPARDEAIAAYRLRASEPQAIRAVARLFSRAGQPDGLAFWKELRKLEPLTRAEAQMIFQPELKIASIDRLNQASA